MLANMLKNLRKALHLIWYIVTFSSKINKFPTIIFDKLVAIIYKISDLNKIILQVA